MDNIKPNFENLGAAICMGPVLRAEVEKQLLRDLSEYIEIHEEILFDWSESCNEGTVLVYLDGHVENLSGIKLFNKEGRLVAEGWMEFIYREKDDVFLVYWDQLDLYKDNKEIRLRYFEGVPEHIKRKLIDI